MMRDLNGPWRDGAAEYYCCAAIEPMCLAPAPIIDTRRAGLAYCPKHARKEIEL